MSFCFAPFSCLAVFQFLSHVLTIFSDRWWYIWYDDGIVNDDIDDFDDDNNDDIDYSGDDDDANLGVWASSSFMRASIPTWLSSPPPPPAARPASEDKS